MGPKSARSCALAWMTKALGVRTPWTWEVGGVPAGRAELVEHCTAKGTRRHHLQQPSGVRIAVGGRLGRRSAPRLAMMALKRGPQPTGPALVRVAVQLAQSARAFSPR